MSGIKNEIRILAIPRGKYNPFKHGNAFAPYDSSPDVWAIQIRVYDKPYDWESIPIVRETEEN